MSTQPSTPLAATVAAQVQDWLAANDDAPGGLYAHMLQEVERPLLILALQRCEGNQLKAAALLGINRNTLRKKLRDYGLITRKRSA